MSKVYALEDFGLLGSTDTGNTPDARPQPHQPSPDFAELELRFVRPGGSGRKIYARVNLADPTETLIEQHLRPMLLTLLIDGGVIDR